MLVVHWCVVQLPEPAAEQDEHRQHAVLPRARALGRAHTLPPKRLVCLSVSVCLYVIECLLVCRNLLVYGRKRWFLFPPKRTVYSKKHANQWLREDYPSLE